MMSFGKDTNFKKKPERRRSCSFDERTDSDSQWVFAWNGAGDMNEHLEVILMNQVFEDYIKGYHSNFSELDKYAKENGIIGKYYSSIKGRYRKFFGRIRNRFHFHKKWISNQIR